MHKQHLITLKLRVKQKGGRNYFSPKPFHSLPAVHNLPIMTQSFKKSTAMGLAVLNMDAVS